ncbi:MAG: trypsin-like serine protease, partial [Thermoplasmatota archaeon]
LSGCTLSFAYDGVGAHAGKVFFSTAAHCVTGVGQVLSSEGFPNFGTVVFQGDPDSTIRDFALIEVAPAFHSAVTGEVRGHPGVPVGVATPADTAPGDLVRMSGWGLAFTQTEVTREQRVGYLLNHETDIIQFIGPVVQGDSGGPWFTDDGLALGIASKISFSIPPGVIGVENAMPYWTDFIRDEGPTIQNFLVDAAAHGFTIQLRTA